MVEHDRLIRKGTGEREDIAKLGFQHPGIEGQAELRKGRETGAKGIGAVKPLGRVEGRPEHVRVGIPGARMPDAFEASVSGSNQRLNHGRDRIAQRQIGMAHDPCTGPILAVKAARALCRDAVHILDLADGLHRLLAIGGIIGAAFHEDGRQHAVRGCVRRSGADIRS